MARPTRHRWKPSDEQMRLWPAISGNAINGVGEKTRRRPSPIYWHAPDATPHGPLQRWFYARTASTDPAIAEARAERQAAIDAPLAEIAVECTERASDDWAAFAEREARRLGAGAVGVTAMRAELVYAGHDVPTQPWMIVLGIAQDYAAMRSAPSVRALVEITRQYAHGMRVAKGVANWIRSQGYDALPYAGPMAGSFLLIPAAIEAGLGELGKHGSLIHPELGSNFRLACVLTTAPLAPSAKATFGAESFCTNCRLCSDACPPDAISSEKVLVRGEERFYVDFDKCLPYFNENMSCAICLAACPFSTPVVGPRLVQKLALRPRALQKTRK
jgi:ferredoxin